MTTNESSITVNPAELHVPPPVSQVKARRLFRKAPGFITATISERANAQGCVMAQFVDFEPPSGIDDGDKLADELGIEYGGRDAWPSAVEQLNAYFENRANLVLTKSWVGSVGTGDETVTSITVLISTLFEEEDLRELEEIQRAVDSHMTQYREQKAAQEAKEREASEAEARQLEADAALGKKAREHNLLGKLELLEGKLKRAVKQRNKLAQASGISFDDEEDSDAV